MTKKDIIDAYVRIRKIDQTIPDEVLDFMKDAAIDKLEQIEFQLRFKEEFKSTHEIVNGAWQLKTNKQ